VSIQTDLPGSHKAAMPASVSLSLLSECVSNPNVIAQVPGNGNRQRFRVWHEPSQIGAIQNAPVTTFDTTRQTQRRAEREKPLILLAHPSGVEPETF